MDIRETMEFIHSSTWMGVVPGLERVRELLGKMGNPQDRMKYIHIGGTNGKGSTAAMLSSVLRASGYRTGLYTSPYITRFNERFQVNGEEISDDELAEIATMVRPLTETMEDVPSEFELITCIAFEYFKRQKCDIVVLEVGMGGEFDATNIIKAPEAAILMNIGLDHIEYLGDTVEKIAATKSGIIKTGCDAVIYSLPENIKEVIRSRCEETGVTLHESAPGELELLEHDLEGQHFNSKEFKDLFIPLVGEHQISNVSVVLKTVEVLRKRGFDISEDSLRRGLCDTKWPGRFELLRRDPVFVVDGGHNPQCAAALLANVREYFPEGGLIVLTGVLSDKDFREMYGDIAPYVREYVTVTPPNPRALKAEKLAEYLSVFGKPVTPCSSVAEGVGKALEAAGQKGAVLAYGSLYMVGDIRMEVSKTLTGI